MYFNNDDEDRSPSPELMRFVRREFYANSSSLDLSPYDLRIVPTHTEDGIPIRKLYVSNLPPKTTRSELFGVFAQYGFIKSCWLKMGDNHSNNKPSSPTYAFVTYSDRADAQKALLAPHHEKTLRGRNLKTLPADSWHQPVEDSNGVLHWRQRSRSRRDENATPVSSNNNLNEDITTNGESLNADTAEYESPDSEIGIVPEQDEDTSNNILDVLNMDCLTCILDYIPIRELILSERVSKGWQNMIHQYFSNVRMFKTSWWPPTPVALTTAVLRRVLQRIGGSLSRLHIDHTWSVLNDRTAHTIGKFCPELEELQVVSMRTKNWNPLVYGCKKLRRVSFISCSKLTDSSLVQMVKNESSIESLTVANNTHVTGLFLTSMNDSKITSLAFSNCFQLQGSLLCAVASSLSNLTTLKLDVCPVTMWRVIPRILKKLPRLQELSLSEFMSNGSSVLKSGDNSNQFCEAIGMLTKLKKLNLSKNIKITNAVLQRVADSCPYLECLNVSRCNSKTGTSYTGVGDEGIAAVCRGCTVLRQLDVSYLAALTDAGLRNVALLTCLTHLTGRGNSALTAAALVPCLASCHRLQELDVCGCKRVSAEETCAAAVAALQTNPRPLTLRLAGTSPIISQHELPSHEYLSVDIIVDLSHDYMRPDFVDSLYDEDSTGDSLDSYEFDHEDLLLNDNNFYFSDDMEEFEDFWHIALNAPQLIIL